jgi:hypothetical protein
MQYFAMSICDHDHLRVQGRLIPCDRIGEEFVDAGQITQQQLKSHKALRHHPVVLSSLHSL